MLYAAPGAAGAKLACRPRHDNFIGGPPQKSGGEGVPPPGLPNGAVARVGAAGRAAAGGVVVAAEPRRLALRVPPRPRPRRLRCRPSATRAVTGSRRL